MTPNFILAAREGFEVPGAEDFYRPPFIDINLFGIDMGINRTVVVLFLAATLTLLLLGLGFRKPKLVPRGVQNVAEVGVEFVRDRIIMPVMGAKGLAYLPFLTTMFFFILFCNWFGIIPGMNFSATSRIAIPLALALCTWIVFVWAGIRAHGGFGYLKAALVPSGVPLPILILLVPIEFITVFFLRPLTLTIRLTANMIAGHLLLTVFLLGTAYLLGKSSTIPFAIGSMLMGTAFIGFELFVGALQAFIFTILTAVYIQSSVQEAH